MSSSEPDSGRCPPVLTARSVVRPVCWWTRFGVMLALGVTFGVLHWFAPDRHGFYPRCGFHALTGYHCPGCGGLRSVHYLTHGQWVQAARSNVLVVGVLPMVLAVAAHRWWRGQGGLRLSEISGRWLWWGAIVVLAFGMLRNLPVEPFRWLAPGP